MSHASAACVERVVLKLDRVGEHSPPKSGHYKGEAQPPKAMALKRREQIDQVSQPPMRSAPLPNLLPE